MYNTRMEFQYFKYVTKHAVTEENQQNIRKGTVINIINLKRNAKLRVGETQSSRYINCEAMYLGEVNILY